MHRQAADALELLDGKTFGTAAEIAKHLLEGSDEARNAARNNIADQDAAMVQTKARADFLLRLGETQARAGLYNAAIATLSQASEAADRIGDMSLVARIALAMPDQLLPLPGDRNSAAALLARSVLSKANSL